MGQAPAPSPSAPKKLRRFTDKVLVSSACPGVGKVVREKSLALTRKWVPIVLAAALAAGVLALVIRLAGRPPAHGPAGAADAGAAAEPIDALIVGSGIAGLSAAYELGRGGARVVIVDMASVFGGHAVMATGDLCMVGTPFQEEKGQKDSPDLAYKDFMA